VEIEWSPPPTLVDENLDPDLAPALAGALGAKVSSARSRGWLGLKNGPLLEAMAEAGLGVLVTGDARLWRERRVLLERHRVGVVLVRQPRSAGARVAAIAAGVRAVRAGELREVPA